MGQACLIAIAKKRQYFHISIHPVSESNLVSCILDMISVMPFSAVDRFT
jgi:hypothetical protein